MVFYDIVCSLCTEKGITITDVTKALKISKSNVTNWKNGSVPKADKLDKIADYFDVSTDYLLGKSDIRKPEQSDDELLRLLDDPINRGIFEKLKAMSPEARKVALAQLDALAKYPDREDKK